MYQLEIIIVVQATVAMARLWSQCSGYLFISFSLLAKEVVLSDKVTCPGPLGGTWQSWDLRPLVLAPVFPTTMAAAS